MSFANHMQELYEEISTGLETSIKETEKLKAEAGALSLNQVNVDLRKERAKTASLEAQLDQARCYIVGSQP